MKHRFILPAALAAAALSLAACTPAAIVEPSGGAMSNPSPSATAPAYVPLEGVEPTAALADMKWIDNGADAEPGLTFTSPVNFSKSGARVVQDGNGAALVAGQILSFQVVQYSGNDGSVQLSTYTEGKASSVPLAETSLDPVLFELLQTVHVGARLLYAVPDQGSGAAVVAFIVSGVTDVLNRAEGDAVAPVGGLPVVTLDADGKPSVSFAGLTKPTELVSQDLITGFGPAVVEGQTLTAHYTGWVWDGDQFDSSWDRGAPATFTIATGQLIDGWVQGLAGKTVGSQVLLVIPPSLGYGAGGSGSIPGDATLVFVVDILAAN